MPSPLRPAVGGLLVLVPRDAKAAPSTAAAPPAAQAPSSASTTPPGGVVSAPVDASREEEALRLVVGTRRLARSARERGDTPTAIRLYEELLAAQPRLFPDWRAQAHFELGQVYLKSAQPAAARAAYERAFAEMLPAASPVPSSPVTSPQSTSPQSTSLQGPAAPRAASALSPLLLYTRLHLRRGLGIVLREAGDQAAIRALLQAEVPTVIEAARDTGLHTMGGWTKSRAEAAITLFELGEALRLSRDSAPASVSTSSQRLEQVLEVHTQVLSAAPMLLDAQFQRRSETLEAPLLYPQLVTLLCETGRADQALGWAKLCFVTGPCDSDSLARSTLLLAQAWGAGAGTGTGAETGTGAGGGLDAGLAFDRAQSAPDLPNPLRAVALPPLDGAALRQGVERSLARASSAQAPAPERALACHDAITALLALGTPRDLGQAMRLAQRQWQSDKAQSASDQPQGAQGTAAPTVPAPPATARSTTALPRFSGVEEVCRVFKAADCGTARGQAFRDFAAGRGPDPLPAFFRDFPPTPL